MDKKKLKYERNERLTSPEMNNCMDQYNELKYQRNERLTAPEANNCMNKYNRLKYEKLCWNKVKTQQISGKIH